MTDEPRPADGKVRTRKRQKRMYLRTARIPIKDVSGSMPSLHYELGTGKTADGRPMRFLVHINQSCFWLQVGDEMYQVLTQDIMDAIASEAVR